MMKFVTIMAIVAFASAAEKVNVGVYTESLCPGCADFATSTLKDAMSDKGIADIVNLKWVVYGNAERRGDKFQCQHGPSECTGNLIETCAIALYNTTYLPFMYCMEGDLDPSDARSCAQQTGLDYEKIHSCAQGSTGTQLEVKAAEETESLNPPHQYVPWVTVNGEALEDDMDNLVSYICKAYKGPKPSACNQLAARPRTRINGRTVCARAFAGEALEEELLA